jgi:hypothetical protein
MVVLLLDTLTIFGHCMGEQRLFLRKRALPCGEVPLTFHIIGDSETLFNRSFLFFMKSPGKFFVYFYEKGGNLPPQPL